MIFVDTSVPLYMVGSPHPYKDRAEALIEQLRASGEKFATDMEVYQELLHLYSVALSFNMTDVAFEKLDSIVDKVFTFGLPEIHAAKELNFAFPNISARNALHIAVMRREGITRILSFEHRLDDCPGIERIS